MAGFGGIEEILGQLVSQEPGLAARKVKATCPLFPEPRYLTEVMILGLSHQLSLVRETVVNAQAQQAPSNQSV